MTDFLLNLTSWLNVGEWFTWVNWLLHPERRTGRLRMAHRLEWPRYIMIAGQKIANPSGGEIERILRRYGVPIWGRAVNGRNYVCYVPGQQGQWAEELLRRRLHGDPLPQQRAERGRKP